MSLWDKTMKSMAVKILLWVTTIRSLVLIILSLLTTLREKSMEVYFWESGKSNSAKSSL